jgi:hypothetical protein
MARLTAADRAKISKSSFAIPSKAGSASAKKQSGNYPINDRTHAQNALARVAQHGTSAEKAQVRAAVKRKYPAIGQAKGKAGKAGQGRK